MSITKYRDIMDICSQISIKAEDERITDIVEWVRMSLEKDHKPTMALISFNLNHAERCSFIEQYIGIKIPKEIIQWMEGEPVCFILDYHEIPVIMNEGDMMGDKMIFGLPSEQLKKNRIVICDEIRSEDDWLALSDEIDIGCLVINATMAMNQMERAWLKNCAKPLFSNQELVIMIARTDRLNEEEEAQSVRKAVNAELSRLNITTEMFEKAQEAMSWMEKFLKDNPGRERHDKRVVRNGMGILNGQMKLLINSAVIDEAAIQSVVNLLEKQKKSLRLAGRLASESILCNDVNRLKAQVSDSVRAYGVQMTENLCSKIEKIPLDQLETMDNKMNSYIFSAWEYYLHSMSLKMEIEIEKIMENLAKQMEKDAGTLIACLDESAQKIIYEAMELKEADSIAMLECENAGCTKELSADIGVAAIGEQLRKETRNMMLLSVPLFFVNPLLSIGNILAARILGKVRMESEMKNAKTEITKQIEGTCFRNTEIIVQQIEESFADAARAGSLNVEIAYGRLIQQIEDDLNELIKKQNDKMNLQKYLEEQVVTVFPRILAEIGG